MHREISYSRIPCTVAQFKQDAERVTMPYEFSHPIHITFKAESKNCEMFQAFTGEFCRSIELLLFCTLQSLSLVQENFFQWNMSHLQEEGRIIIESKLLLMPTLGVKLLWGTLSCQEGGWGRVGRCLTEQLNQIIQSGIHNVYDPAVCAAKPAFDPLRQICSPQICIKMYVKFMPPQDKHSVSSDPQSQSAGCSRTICLGKVIRNMSQSAKRLKGCRTKQSVAFWFVTLPTEAIV